MKYYIQAWANAFNFSGRARRREYWFFVLFNGLVMMALAFAAVFTSTPEQLKALESGGLFALGVPPLVLAMQLLNIATILPSISVLVRRLHDTDHSGLWVLTLFIPFLNIIFAILLLIWALSDSDSAHNNYGPSPKGGPVTPPMSAGSISGQFTPQPMPSEPEGYVNPFTKSA